MKITLKKLQIQDKFLFIGPLNTSINLFEVVLKDATFQKMNILYNILILYLAR